MAKKNDDIVYLVEDSNQPLLVEGQSAPILVEEQSSPVSAEKVPATRKKQNRPPSSKKIEVDDNNEQSTETIDKQYKENSQWKRYIEEGHKSTHFRKFKGAFVIPNGAIKIGDNAFEECDKITSITVPDSVMSIGRFAFGYCSELSSVNIGMKVRSIDMFAFVDCINLTNIVIPEGVTDIGISAFKGCSRLTSIVLPKSIKNIHYRAFEGCFALEKIVIPKGTKNQFAEMDAMQDFVDYLVEEGRISVGERKQVQVIGQIEKNENSSKQSNTLMDLLSITRHSQTPIMQTSSAKRSDNTNDDYTELDVVLNKARRLAKVVELLPKIIYGSFLAASAILIIINSIMAYVESSWYGCLLAVVVTFFLFYGELEIVGKVGDECEIGSESKTQLTILHYIWRAMWITGMVVLGEVIFLWLFKFWGLL